MISIIFDCPLYGNKYNKYSLIKELKNIKYSLNRIYVDLFLRLILNTKYTFMIFAKLNAVLISHSTYLKKLFQ